MGKKVHSTPEGAPHTKWEKDPISALHEHYKKEGVAQPDYKFHSGGWNGTRSNAWNCTVKLLDVEIPVSGSGANKKEAKRSAATQACAHYFR